MISKDMPNIFVVADRTEKIDQLCHYLSQDGYICSFASDRQNAVEELEEIGSETINLVLIDSIEQPGAASLCYTLKTEKNKPVIALVQQQELNDNHIPLDVIDDFVIVPFNFPEVRLRIARLVGKVKRNDSGEIIRCGDLAIDTAKYEVYVGESPVNLTFTEYELLKFLASNRGRVFSRETLLNRVWGYDYYGGDRTVDVHITRLRSKIEISGRIFIETVRSIGYRFKDR